MKVVLISPPSVSSLRSPPLGLPHLSAHPRSRARGLRWMGSDRPVVLGDGHADTHADLLGGIVARTSG